MAIGSSLVATLGLNSTSFATGLTNASKKSKTFAQKFKGSMGNLQAAFIGVTAVLGTKKLLDNADAMTKNAKAAGFGFEEYQRLQHGFEEAGISQEAFQKSTVKLSKAFNDASRGSKTATDAFEAIGLSFEALEKLKPEERFIAVNLALGKVDDASKRQALSLELLGKGYAGVTVDMDAVVAAGEKLVVITDEAGASSEGSNDAFLLLGKNLKNLTVNILGPLVQQLTPVISGFAEFAKQHPTITKLAVAVTAIGVAVKALGGPLSIVVTAIGLAIAAWKNWDEIVGFFKAKWDEFSKAFPGTSDSIKKAIDILLVPIKHLATGIGLAIDAWNNWDEVVALFKTKWDEFSNAFPGTSAAIQKAIDILLTPIKTLATGIGLAVTAWQNWDEVVALFKTKWDQFSSVFPGTSELIRKAVDILLVPIKSLATNIGLVISAWGDWDKVVALFKTKWDEFSSAFPGTSAALKKAFDILLVPIKSIAETLGLVIDAWGDWDEIVGIFKTKWDQFSSAFPGAASAIKGAIDIMLVPLDKLKTAFKSVFTVFEDFSIKEILAGVVDSVRSKLKEMLLSVEDIISKIPLVGEKAAKKFHDNVIYWFEETKANSLDRSPIPDLVDGVEAYMDTLPTIAEKASRGFHYHITTGFKDAMEEASRTTEQYRDLGTRVFDGMTNSLINFAQTGKLNFRSFAQSVINDIIAINIRAAASSLFGSIAGGLFGGPIGAIVGGLFGGGRASGGPVAAGTSYLVGEQGPELFTPSSNGNITPNGGAGGTTTVTVNVSGNLDDRAINQIRNVIASSSDLVGQGAQFFNQSTQGLSLQRG